MSDYPNMKTNGVNVMLNLAGYTMGITSRKSADRARNSCDKLRNGNGQIHCRGCR